MILENLKTASSEKALASTSIVNYIKSKEYKLNQGSFDMEYLVDMLSSQRCSLRVTDVHEYSISLAKVMCLFDEVLALDTDTVVNVFKYLREDQKANKLSPIIKKDFDQYLLILSGRIGIKVFERPSPLTTKDVELN